VPVATEQLGDITFMFFKQKMAWSAARSFCKDQGGSLATVTSAEQDQLVVSTCMNTLIGQVSSGDHGYWIGLGDGDKEGSYTWVDGRPMSYSGWYRGDWTEPNDATSVSSEPATSQRLSLLRAAIDTVCSDLDCRCTHPAAQDHRSRRHHPRNVFPAGAGGGLRASCRSLGGHQAGIRVARRALRVGVLCHLPDGWVLLCPRAALFK
jgi:hypothetical protein